MKRTAILYIVLAVLTGLSYWSIRPYIVVQEPPQAYITVSNLTLNYVLFYMFIGGLTYWVANKKLFRKVSTAKRSVFSMAFTVTVAAVVLILLSPWYQIR